jgi:glycosyltransferase involved in cell wall biosynthesis
MKVSVLVCTYNRAPFLEKVLNSLSHQEFEGEHEIIVVDNNSTDNTKAIAEKWIPLAHPRCPIRYTFAAQQGLSCARNAGAQAANGDVIASIDDDAVAEKNWLQCIVDNLADPSIACVGGQVLLEWSEPPPDWITPDLWSVLGASSMHGDTRTIMRGRLYPMGGNMAVRRSWYEALGGMNTQLGRCGESLLSLEEIEFGDRLRRRGGIAVYDPQMIIHHYVPHSRMTREYISRRFYWEGRSMSAWQRIKGGQVRQWAYGLLRTGLTGPRDLLRWLYHSTVGTRSSVFAQRCRLRKTRGYLDEMWQGLVAK